MGSNSIPLVQNSLNPSGSLDSGLSWGGAGGPCSVLKQDSTLLCSVLSGNQGTLQAEDAMSWCLCQAENFLLQEKKNQTKKGFFFLSLGWGILEEGSLQGAGSERGWLCAPIHRWLSVTPGCSWGFSSALRGPSPGRAGNEPLARQGESCAQV